jgi:hypothetical protein
MKSKNLLLPLLVALFCVGGSHAEESLEQAFKQPPDSARPWVYWYFQDGHLTREGMKADLEAMKKAGIGGALYLEVTAMGIPKGPIEFMSPKWQDLIVAAIHDCERLGLEFALGTGPGWCGAGGPWIKPDDAMQHLVGTATQVSGPKPIKLALPKPAPRDPFFGRGTLSGNLLKEWQEYYRDTAVIAFPTPATLYRLPDTEEKALFHRAPYTTGCVKAYLPPDSTVLPASECIDSKQVVELTDKLAPDGTLSWEVPPGNWTIMRYGRTLTGQTTRPAPQPGLGWESGKFEKSSADAHFENYLAPLVLKLRKQEHSGRGWTTMHFDSWEMSSQNWSPNFREEFKKRRGYDPLPYLPAMQGQVVESVENTERFLWDLRRTAQELVLENQAGRFKELAAKQDLTFTIEPYDLNPAGDLALGDVADTPSCEFWSPNGGVHTEYSAFEAVSCGHTRGRKVIQGEAFTSYMDAWRQHPCSMKEQGDWAFCAGVNRFTFHRYSAQPELDKKPGLPWGPYGVHWERTQTWWEMVPAYHEYLTRCQALLQRGLPVNDVLYLDLEGAPNVFRPPASALLPRYPDRKGYNFDGCSPGTLIERATVKDGRIAFPNGTSYRLLVLPRSETMTPGLLRKVKSLVDEGALVMGCLPKRSPSLENQPQSDEEVTRLSKELAESKRVLPDEALPPPKPASILSDSKWIWTDEVKKDPLNAAAGKRYFSREIEIPESVTFATCAMSADNSFELSINGKSAGSGNNWNKEWKFDIAPLLKPGKNTISVVAENTEKGAAGLIGALVVNLSDGKTLRIPTDKTWLAGANAASPLTAAFEVRNADQAPWEALVHRERPPVLYPPYEVTAKILADRGVPPDFASNGDLRYIHRVDGDTDYYFVGNRKAEPQKADVSFRVTGRTPYLWDPLTGTERLLPQYSEKEGITTIPMEFASTQSFFVVFKPKAGDAPATAGEKNFPELQPLLSLDKEWTVTFDPKWGGPEKPVIFSTLDDWSKREEEGIKHYSGTAVYEKTFDLPSVPTKETCLSLGRVAVMAEVTLNGKDLGVAWCPPWQVTIPAGLLKKTGNKLEVKVANLWLNRLIGDAALPPERRFTDLGGSSIKFYKATDTLQSSGLLGPVKLEGVK